MHSVGIHKGIAHLISYYYRIGFWHRGDEPTAKELRIKCFYCIYYLLFLLSLVVGAIKSDNYDDMIFLSEVSVVVVVLSVKMWFFIFKQKQIIEMLNRICVFSIRQQHDFTSVDEKLRKFMKLVTAFAILLNVSGVFAGILPPLLGSEKNLFFKIAFPLNWKENEVAYWIAVTFTFTEVYLSLITVSFTIIIWYLMTNCSLRYEVLGNEIRNMGQINKENKRKISDKEKQDLYLHDLKASIDDHLHIRE